jgi:hypothetical protein
MSSTAALRHNATLWHIRRLNPSGLADENAVSAKSIALRRHWRLQVATNDCVSIQPLVPDRLHGVCGYQRRSVAKVWFHIRPKARNLELTRSISMHHRMEGVHAHTSVDRTSLIIMRRQGPMFYQLFSDSALPLAACAPRFKSDNFVFLK